MELALNRIRPSIPANVSLLDVRGGVEPFTDKPPHLGLLISRHLFSAGVIITEVAYQVRYFSVGNLVSELYKRNRFAAIEVIAW